MLQCCKRGSSFPLLHPSTLRTTSSPPPSSFSYSPRFSSSSVVHTTENPSTALPVSPADAHAKPKVRRRPGGATLTQKAALEVSRKNWLATLSSELLLPLPQNGPQKAESDMARSEMLLEAADSVQLDTCVHTLAKAGPCKLDVRAQAGLQGSAVCATESGANIDSELAGILGDFEPVPCVGTTVVLGIDPDVAGAVAVLRGDDATTAEVFDVPSVAVMVGGKQRRRHNARLMVDLIQRLSIPQGSVAYIEQSMILPANGKQGWWATGFGFGMWIGVLVASGLSVVPVPPAVWKRALYLTGKAITKDDCRASACLLFPTLASQLKRKKDHGRAEALLIAAYGKGIPEPS